jgi:flagellar L-ring protein precursor FlgH
MKRLTVLILLVLSFAIGFADDAQPGDSAGTLWKHDTPNPLKDRTARKEGDILTIVISETSTASFSASTDTKKDEANSVLKPIIPILSTLMPGLIPNLAGSSSGGISSKGSGTTTSAGKFSAKMSAVVKKVMPNGNLVIEGSRYVQVNKDTQKFVLTGVIRPDDVRSDNTVLSESMAEAEIKVDGKGAISDRQRRGILSRILDWLF